jgi:Protein of unknown function (DUF3551)
MPMRSLLFGLAIATATAAAAAPAHAQNYPWCATTSIGGLNCGFETQTQCLDYLLGMGGFCLPNTQYKPPPPEPPQAAEPVEPAAPPPPKPKGL